MMDTTDLKKLAEAATPGEWCHEQDCLYFKEDGYTKHMMELAEGDDVGYGGQKKNADFIAAANPAAVLALIAENDRIKAENEVARMRIKELDLLFGRYLLGMRSAVIDEECGGHGMVWIYNALRGPGELPPEDETDAQAYFDREIVAVDAGLEEVAVFFDALRADKKVKP